MSRLSWAEVKSLVEEAGELAEGESVKLHHCKEGKGNDRCYVTRKHDATLVYCFHCGSSGSVVDKFASVNKARGTSKKSAPPTRFYSPPSDATKDVSKWSTRSLGWIGKAKLTTKEVAAYGMSYSPTKQRVYIPLYNDGSIVGWLARQIECDGQKYLLSKRKDFLFHIDNGGDVCIIVEDILSAIRIGRKYSVLALMGTNLSDLQVRALAKYKQVVVWMDNDNPDVKMKQVKVRNRMSSFSSVSMLKTDRDPKEYTDVEIEEKVDEVIHRA